MSPLLSGLYNDARRISCNLYQTVDWSAKHLHFAQIKSNMVLSRICQLICLIAICQKQCGSFSIKLQRLPSPAKFADKIKELGITSQMVNSAPIQFIRSKASDIVQFTIKASKEIPLGIKQFSAQASKGMPSNIQQSAAAATTALSQKFLLSLAAVSISPITCACLTGLILLAAIITRYRSKLAKGIALAVNEMEGGWTKRGYGGGFSRTWEVWSFAFSFIFKYVSTSSQIFNVPDRVLTSSNVCIFSLRWRS